MLVAPSITWLLVRISPDDVITMPVPDAVAPSMVDVIFTTAGLAEFPICEVAGPPSLPLEADGAGTVAGSLTTDGRSCWVRRWPPIHRPATRDATSRAITAKPPPPRRGEAGGGAGGGGGVADGGTEAPPPAP